MVHCEKWQFFIIFFIWPSPRLFKKGSRLDWEPLNQVTVALLPTCLWYATNIPGNTAGSTTLFCNHFQTFHSFIYLTFIIIPQPISIPRGGEDLSIQTAIEHKIFFSWVFKKSNTIALLVTKQQTLDLISILQSKTHDILHVSGMGLPWPRPPAPKHVGIFGTPLVQNSCLHSCFKKEIKATCMKTK